jgi:hypothetical protein
MVEIADGAARGCWAGDATRCGMLLAIAWSLMRLAGGFGSSESLLRIESRFERLGASTTAAGAGGGGAGGAEKTELERGGSSRFVGDGLNGILLARDDTVAGAKLLNAGESMPLRVGSAGWKKPRGDAGLVSLIGLRS